MKIHPEEAELFHVDGRTDRQTDITKLMVAFRSFAKTRNKMSNTKCVFWFSLQLLAEKFLILRIIERDFITNVQKPSYKVPVIL